MPLFTHNLLMRDLSSPDFPLRHEHEVSLVGEQSGRGKRLPWVFLFLKIIGESRESPFRRFCECTSIMNCFYSEIYWRIVIWRPKHIQYDLNLILLRNLT